MWRNPNVKSRELDRCLQETHSELSKRTKYDSNLAKVIHEVRVRAETYRTQAGVHPEFLPTLTCSCLKKHGSMGQRASSPYKNTRGFPRPPPPTNSRRRVFARKVDFSFIVSGSDRTFTFRVSLNTLPTVATLVRDITMVKYPHKIPQFAN